MRILYISHFFTSRLYRKKLSWLSKLQDVEIAGVTPNMWKDEGIVHIFQPSSGDNVPVFSTRGYFVGDGSLFFLSAFELFRIAQRFKPDIIHIDEEPWSICMLQTLILRRIACPKAKLLFDTSENIPKHIPVPFSLIQQWAFRSASYATAISGEARAVLRQKGFSKPVAVVGHGVEPEFAFTQGQQQEIRRMLGISPDDFCIGYAGIIAQRKGVLTLVDAFTKLAIPSAKLILIGSGPLEQQIRRYVQSHPQLQGRAILVGAIPHDRIPSYLSILDILVLPSLTTPTWKEQFGRVLIEAMVLGVPVIGSNSGGIPEVIGDAGLIFSEGDDEELASLLHALWNNENLRRELGEKGRQRVLDKYTWEKVAQELGRIYQEILREDRSYDGV